MALNIISMSYTTETAVVSLIYSQYGEITPNDVGDKYKYTVQLGDEVTFTISPAYGFRVKDVVLDETSQGDIESLTIEVTQDRTLEATFEVIPTYENDPERVIQSGFWNDTWWIFRNKNEVIGYSFLKSNKGAFKYVFNEYFKPINIITDNQKPYCFSSYITAKEEDDNEYSTIKLTLFENPGVYLDKLNEGDFRYNIKYATRPLYIYKGRDFEGRLLEAIIFAKYPQGDSGIIATIQSNRDGMTVTGEYTQKNSLGIGKNPENASFTVTSGFYGSAFTLSVEKKVQAVNSNEADINLFGYRFKGVLEEVYPENFDLLE